MSDRDLDRLVAATAAFDDDRVAALPLADAEAELCEEIMVTTHEVLRPAQLPRRRLARRWTAAIAAAAALVTAVVAVQSVASQRGPAWAAEVLEVAEAAPRLLVTAPGWDVVRADEFTPEVGEMTFSDGTRELDLHWRPADQHSGYVDDRAHSSGPPGAVEIDGREAVLFRYSDDSFFTALWLDGGHSVELRGGFADEAAYRDLAATLQRVGVDEWLSAMPESVVRPFDRAAVVEEMLAGVPLPAGFDVDALRSGAAVRDRYQLGAQVTGAVACAWIEQWIAAAAAGDGDAAAEALAAMETSTGWAILLEMAEEGGYPDVLWEHAAAMRAGGVAPTGLDVANYGPALGCAVEGS